MVGPVTSISGAGCSCALSAPGIFRSEAVVRLSVSDFTQHEHRCISVHGIQRSMLLRKTTLHTPHIDTPSMCAPSRGRLGRDVPTPFLLGV